MKIKRFFLLTIFMIHLLSLGTLFLFTSSVSAALSDCFVQATGVRARYNNIDGTGINIKSSDNLVLNSMTSEIDAQFSVYTERCTGGQTKNYIGFCSDDAYEEKWKGANCNPGSRINGTAHTFDINAGRRLYSVDFWAGYCTSEGCKWDDEHRKFYYMSQDSNQVTAEGILSAKFTMPWYDQVANANWTNPTYSVLVGTDSAVRANRNSSVIPAGSVEVPIPDSYIFNSDYHPPTSSDHDFRIS